MLDLENYELGTVLYALTELHDSTPQDDPERRVLYGLIGKFKQEKFLKTHKIGY